MKNTRNIYKCPNLYQAQMHIQRDRGSERERDRDRSTDHPITITLNILWWHIYSDHKCCTLNASHTKYWIRIKITTMKPIFISYMIREPITVHLLHCLWSNFPFKLYISMNQLSIVVDKSFANEINTHTQNTI